ncbi:hypothetical protein LguiB_006643 [Lonicera macranthoides]
MEVPPQDELWSGKSRRVITLSDSGLSNLPEEPYRPTLEELFLQNNPDLTEIPPSFFLRMPQLHILDLSNTSIKSLPKSISSLFKLRRLLLRSRELLSELPPEIGDLCNLEMLDLEGTELICLPMEIWWLLRLKLLNVSFYECADQYKRFIPPSTLSRLSLLEELSIDVNQECGSYWYVELAAIISELATLGNLRTLKLPTVGCDEEHVISCLPGGLQDEFVKLKKCLNSLSVFKAYQTSHLEFCLVECNEMKTIVDEADLDSSLEKISLLHLPELVSIFNGLNVARNLEKMVVYNCPKLKNVSPIASEIMKEIKGRIRVAEQPST